MAREKWWAKCHKNFILRLINNPFQNIFAMDKERLTLSSVLIVWTTLSAVMIFCFAFPTSSLSMLQSSIFVTYDWVLLKNIELFCERWPPLLNMCPNYFHSFGMMFSDHFYWRMYRSWIWKYRSTSIFHPTRASIRWKKPQSWPVLSAAYLLCTNHHSF